ncbi:hypothetical protein LCGC14_1829900, partial [marine sediment metagenome]
ETLPKFKDIIGLYAGKEPADKKSTTECRKNCDVYNDWQTLEAQNAGLVLDNAQLKAHIDRLEYTLIPELETKIKEFEAALNMEEAYSQFHPKIPYKWKYEKQLKRTKRQGRFIKKQVAKIKELKEE